MTLPIKATSEDVNVVCQYLATKPMGATCKEAKAVIEGKHLDGRKLAAMKAWNLLEESDGRLKLTAAGRVYVRADEQGKRALVRQVISNCPPYNAVVERAVHTKEDSVTSTDVGSHWHEHFTSLAGKTDNTLNLQAVCFFHLAGAAGLGTVTIGRRGSLTRIEWDHQELGAYLNGLAHEEGRECPEATCEGELEDPGELQQPDDTPAGAGVRKSQGSLGQNIFLAHGKNKTPLEQLKRILGQFSIPFKVAQEEPNLGRPISAKVHDTMQGCNCAILIFTADQKLYDQEGTEVWRPSENVVHELGACSYLYGDRVVVIKEDKIQFPTNFRDIGYISFSEGDLEAKAMDIVKELVGFGILKIVT